jgi:hypothetical protein
MSTRSTVLVLVGIIGMIMVILSSRPNGKPAPLNVSAQENEPQSEIKSSPVPLPALASASRAREIKTQFAAQRARELQNLVHDKLSAWRSEPDSRAQYNLLQELTALLTDENAAGIIQSLSTEDLAGNFGIAALERWLSADPNAAAVWLASRSDTTDEQASLVARMLLQDRDGFQSYLDRLPDGEWKAKIISGAAFEMAASNPQQAIPFAAQMDSGDATGVLQAAAFQWARIDPDAAKQWATQGADADVREELIAAAAKGMAEQHPGEAAEWLLTSVKSPDPLAETLPGIIRSWAGKEPSATADWVAHFPAGIARNEALETVMNFWSASDLPGAKAWAANLPDVSLRQDAVAILDRSKLVPTE